MADTPRASNLNDPAQPSDFSGARRSPRKSPRKTRSPRGSKSQLRSPRGAKPKSPRVDSTKDPPPETQNRSPRAEPSSQTTVEPAQHKKKFSPPKLDLSSSPPVPVSQVGSPSKFKGRRGAPLTPEGTKKNPPYRFTAHAERNSVSLSDIEGDYTDEDRRRSITQSDAKDSEVAESTVDEDDLKDAFAIYDHDMDDALTEKEFREAVRGVGLVLTELELTEIIQKLAEQRKKGVKGITFEEFRTVVQTDGLRRPGDEGSVSRSHTVTQESSADFLRQLDKFRKLNQEDFVDAEDFLVLMTEHCDKLSEEEASQLRQTMTPDPLGRILFKDFVKMFD